MKKRILQIVLLFIGLCSFGQGQYEIKVRGSIIDYRNSYCSEFRIKAVLRNNTEITIYDGSYAEDRRITINETKYISNASPIDRFTIYAKRHHKRNCRTPSKHQISRALDLSYPYTCYYTDHNQYGSDYMNGSGSSNALNEMKLAFSVVPIIQIDPPGINDFLPLDHQIELNATEGFPIGTSTYNWQYSLDNGQTFTDVRYALNRRSSMNISARDLLGAAAESNLGNDILFRIRSCNGESISIPRTYTIVPSAPTFVAKQEYIPSCYENSDGSVRFTFSRPLYPGEKISILPKVGSPLFPSTSDLTELQPHPVTGIKNSYTINNIAPNQYTATVLGFYGRYNTYSDDAEHDMPFEIGRPSIVKIDAVDFTPNWCNDGDSNPDNNNDGTITIKASGGNPGVFQYSYRKVGGTFSAWTNFNGGNENLLTNVPPGDYEVQVRKSVWSGTVNCYAYELNTGGQPTSIIDIATVTVTEPAAPLQIEMIPENTFEPLADGFTDGQIQVRVFGGTKDTNGNYTIEWRNLAGQLLTTSEITKEIDGSGEEQFFTTLKGIGEGKYFLNVTDANFSSATYTAGCFISNSEYTLQDPEPLILRIEETNPISCNEANTETDQDKDGQLTAIASGGVALEVEVNRGLPYYYTWKKKNPISGVWEIYEDRDTATAVISDLSEGEYAVNIEDANGIVIGIYINNQLNSATDVTHVLEAPKPIIINEDTRNVFCYGGNDGYIHLTVEGGTGDYTVEWQDDLTENLDRDNLIEGTYRVTITDQKGCVASKIFEIIQPDAPLALSYPTVYKQPTAFGLTNGWIEATVSGGTTLADGTYPFTWTDQNNTNWNGNVVTSIDPVTDQVTLRLENIGEGYYTLTINDANYTNAVVKEGCTEEAGFRLEEPKPLELTITEDNPISCNQLNEYGNPYSDGILTAHATGGVRFNPGLPYIYTWKKQNNDGSWQLLTSQTDSIASNLDDGTYAVNIEDANGIVLGEYVNNALVREIDSTRVIKEPILLEVSLTKQDVYCHLGSDGWVAGEISGGTEPYKILWNTGAETTRIEELSKGTYEIIVTDDRGCEAIASVDVEQPEVPLEIQYSAFSRPSSIGASDAWIEAEISGGTSFTDGSYTYRWENQSADLLNPQTETEILSNGNYGIRLNNISSGNYYLTIEDANYEIATTKEGCTFIESQYTIYEPIEAVVKEYTPISCNQQNEFLDPYSDGAIVGHVTGGVPFLNGLPYRYTWKKQNDTGTWEVLTNQTDSIATNLSAGWYALNAEDSMGNMMGAYESEFLLRATDSTYNFIEPELLEVSLSSTPISCDTGNDGTASVAITGGIPPYDIEWSTGATTATTTGLISGTYIAYVTDARGCQVSERIFIDQPGGIVVTITTQQNPTCFKGNDGVIELNVTGGSPPFQYEWENSETSTSRFNLTQGIYTLSITDSEGCRAFEQIELEDPLQIPIELGENRTICTDQSLELDITIEDPGATYLWTSDRGYTSSDAKVTLTDAGVYTATIKNSLGCTHTDTVNVTVSNDEIDADFLITTQAYAKQEVILVNVSYPKGDTSIWKIPEGVEVVNNNDDQLVLIFDKVGNYEFGLRSYVGDCYADFSKTILVGEAIDSPVSEEERNAFIEELIVYPNPSAGQFKVKVALAEQANIQVNIINLLTSTEMSAREATSSSDYLLDYDMSHLPSGIYLLTVETPRGNAIRKIVIE